jgi:hypothetical protein
MKCKTCGEISHFCTSCCDDGHSEWGYCSESCMKSSKEFGLIKERIMDLKGSVTDSQRKTLIYILDEMPSGFDPYVIEMLKTPEELEAERIAREERSRHLPTVRVKRYKLVEIEEIKEEGKI